MFEQIVIDLIVCGIWGIVFAAFVWAAIKDGQKNGL